MANDAYSAVICALGWFSCSVLISVYNKWMFSDGLNFVFPLFITAYHQVCLFVFSLIFILIFPKLRPNIKRPNCEDTSLLSIPLYVFITLILPCAFASAGDIGLSNASLLFIPLSLYTMVKTSSLLFVLVFGLLFRLEKFNWRLIVIVVIMCISVSMMTLKPETKEKLPESSAHSFGVMLILMASALLGLRWCFTQMLLKKSKHTSNPILTIFYLAPGMAVFLFSLALPVEGWEKFTSLPVWEAKGFMWTMTLMTFPAVLAFILTICEFQLLTHIQILTLSIAGIAKELLTIATSAVVFGDTLSWVNGIGLFITILDILYYNYFRFKENEVNAKAYKPVTQSESEPTTEFDMELEDR